MSGALFALSGVALASCLLLMLASYALYAQAQPGKPGRASDLLGGLGILLSPVTVLLFLAACILAATNR